VPGPSPRRVDGGQINTRSYQAQKRAQMKTGDPINHPKHYTQGKIKVLDFILDKDLNYLAGNIVKYIPGTDSKGCLPRILKRRGFTWTDRLPKWNRKPKPWTPTMGLATAKEITWRLRNKRPA